MSYKGIKTVDLSLPLRIAVYFAYWVIAWKIIVFIGIIILYFSGGL